MAGGGGKEGDWECGGCHNRNYAFRSFCNRCKLPRLLVDTKTPADSKWLPRIGDWICTGCTNNNYASREKCKKCGQPKELAAMPAVAIPGASVPTHPTYFARARGGMEQMVNVGSIHPSISLNSDWSVGGANQYGNQPSDLYGLLSVSNWPLRGDSISGLSYSSQANLLPPAPNGNGWRSGDWMCTCGFHNYSSRLQCKKCNAPAPISTPASLGSPVTAHGTKRLASEEFVHNFDNKRLNAGQAYGLQQPNSGLDPFLSPGGSQMNNMYTPMHSGNTPIPPNWQVNQVSRLAPAPAPAHIGKGAKQWRDGDWMCSNCNNHNYASREQCNRCKSMRELPVQPVSVA
ncbi:uncharacterized RNA-binding protein C17H9.04c-like [Salvia splendens]|uniref:uncharacterized RNA-binding protein C17H9.04c-like n=1 Tax=Salvia splendens TaxID=180675 RepID=UPI001C2622C0|nr:uncharacterized RNA-binding protein C17H9.04c-like [Salvia splendens]